MKVSKAVSKPSYIIGLPQTDFLIWLGYTMISMFINNALMSFGVSLKFWGYIFIIVTSWSVFLLLKWGAKQNHAGFILSYLSFRFLQPKKVTTSGFSIKVINKDNGQ